MLVCKVFFTCLNQELPNQEIKGMNAIGSMRVWHHAT